MITYFSLLNDFDHLFKSTSSNYFMDEDEKKYLLYLDMPGVKKEDLKIEVKDSNLVILGESKERSRKYNRVFNLPNFADIDNIEADLVDGVLKVNIPKLKEKAKLVRIK